MANRLAVHQALWAMSGLGEASLAQKFDRVAAAGFDGMSIDLGALTMQEAEATIPHFERTGLAPGLTAFPDSLVSLRSALQFARRLGAPYLVVIGQDMPLRLEDMVRVIEAWLDVAAGEGVSIQFETHRNGITNDLFSTLQLLDAVPAMRLAADLSHYVVDREMPCPPPPALRRMISTLLSRAESIQGRVAARGQIQVALQFPQHQRWVKMFLEWWREGIETWQARHVDATLVFLCELGPPDYAITDGNGRELSDRWEESLLLMQWARDLWAAAGEAACASLTKYTFV